MKGTTSAAGKTQGSTYFVLMSKAEKIRGA